MQPPNPEKAYTWEILTTDGTVYSQYDDEGNEQPFPSINPKEVIRVCYNPIVPTLPPHILTFGEGLEFVRRFGRGFIRMSGSSQSKYYVFCTVTNKFRFYLLPDGRVITTHKDYELKKI